MIAYKVSKNAKILFVGINPHPGSYRRGVPFSNNKMFWYLLNRAGLLDEVESDLKSDVSLTKAYEAGHIPGAAGFNWQTQLQDQVRRDIISKEAFEKLLGDAGISPNDTVILYGDNNNWFSAYGFWLFKIYGHKDVRLMNGGRVKWLNENDK